MVLTALPGDSVELRAEIDLLLEDISEEPMPENISTLLTKAQAGRQRSGWGVDGSLDENYLAPNEVAHVARYLRKNYPFESLTQRLAYERQAKHSRTRLSNDANTWLAELDSASAIDPRAKLTTSTFAAERAHALTQLHSDEVVAFINRDGEGISRMPTYGVEFVVLPDDPAIPLAVDADDWQQRPSNSSFVIQRSRDRQNRRYEERGPFFQLHASYREDFAATRNGLVVSVDRVAGFAPHAITHRKDVHGPISSPMSTQLSTRNVSAQDLSSTVKESSPLWRVANLQLVSLLKSDRPQVYVSEFMPAMTELPNMEMRELNSFEVYALRRLYAGEDLVSDTTDDKIRMLGSLRASKDCRSCHSVERGEILGAFSYELVRVATPSSYALSSAPK
jgi:hypothetical protein